MDNDGRADTPWQFIKPLGNGLYMRVSVRVEDTSSRVNANVADAPLFLEDTTAGADSTWWSAPTPGPLFTPGESLLRTTSYAGYPFLGTWNAVGTYSSFPILTDNVQQPCQFLGRSNSAGSFQRV